MRNQEPIDAFLDLALDEDLETIFWNANNGGDWNAMGEILRSPYVLIGTSDAGAHVLFGADFGYGTILAGPVGARAPSDVVGAGDSQTDLPSGVDLWLAGARFVAAGLCRRYRDLRSRDS